MKPKKLDNIFVVHGSDREMEEAVARVLEKLDLDKTILHEEPDEGGPLYDKFIQSAEKAGTAIILLSPDDEVHVYQKEHRKDEDEQGGVKIKFHPRQNAIFEFGYFVGMPQVENIIVLYRKHDDFEWPSDIAGITYKEYDVYKRWEYDLAVDLRRFGYDVDLHKLSERRSTTPTSKAVFAPSSSQIIHDQTLEKLLENQYNIYSESGAIVKARNIEWIDSNTVKEDITIETENDGLNIVTSDSMTLKLFATVDDATDFVNTQRDDSYIVWSTTWPETDSPYIRTFGHAPSVYIFYDKTVERTFDHEVHMRVLQCDNLVMYGRNETTRGIRLT